ncbi:isocitrate/isopropylmalate family dehydrogenase [Streptomyces sp. NPDC001868]|uniref:isocitrate/isopropylmalate family dehydrogenase n=1 Tax=Streptomyces sp. NPDC001868 TaxID=3154401 RepID=UPI003329F8F5
MPASSSSARTPQATERVARVAFGLPRSRRRKLSIVHKANVLRLTTGLFRTVCQEVAQEYPDVAVDDFHIDAMTVHLVRRAQDFDVIVLFEWLGPRHGDEKASTDARIIEKAVADAIAAGTATRDLGGSASTTEFTAAVIKAIGAGRS